MERVQTDDVKSNPFDPELLRFTIKEVIGQVVSNRAATRRINYIDDFTLKVLGELTVIEDVVTMLLQEEKRMSTAKERNNAFLDALTRKPKYDNKDPTINERIEDMLRMKLTSDKPDDKKLAQDALRTSAKKILNARYPDRISARKNLLAEIDGIPVYLEDFEIRGKFAEIFTARVTMIYGKGTGKDAPDAAELVGKRKRKPRKVKL